MTYRLRLEGLPEGWPECCSSSLTLTAFDSLGYTAIHLDRIEPLLDELKSRIVRDGG